MYSEKNGVLHIEFEQTEAELFDILFNLKIIKGAFAYKKGSFVDINISGYNNNYEIPRYKHKETKKTEPQVVDYENLFEEE